MCLAGMAHCRGQCQLCLPFALQVSSQKRTVLVRHKGEDFLFCKTVTDTEGKHKIPIERITSL